MDKINRQLAEIAAQLGESAALKQAKSKAEAMEEALHQAQAAMQNLNLETRSLADKIAQQEKTLYHGKALSPKEATNLQDEIASLKRRHSQREELLLEAMVGVEEAERQLNEWVDLLARGRPRDQGFRHLPPALGPAEDPPEDVSRAVRALAATGAGAAKDALLLDNVAQFRFYSAWRGTLERRG